MQNLQFKYKSETHPKGTSFGRPAEVTRQVFLSLRAYKNKFNQSKSVNKSFFAYFLYKESRQKSGV